MPHAGRVQPHIKVSSLINSACIQALQGHPVDRKDIQHKQYSLMHFWLVTDQRRERSGSGEQKEEEGEGQSGQWECCSQYSTCISLSARAALSYSAAKQSNKRMKKRDEEKVKESGTPGRINHNTTQEDTQGRERNRIEG